MDRRLRYLILLVITMAAGAAVRFAALGLPRAVTKYGGSGVWAMAIFWFVSLVLPRGSLYLRAGVSLLLSFAIEFFKLVRTPALDAFRLTLPGKLVLGRIFSARDLLAYSVAILFAAALDRVVFSLRPSGTHAIR